MGSRDVQRVQQARSAVGVRSGAAGFLTWPGLPWITLLAVQAWVVFVVFDRGELLDDDFMGAHVALKYPLLESLLVPIDLHVVPLYRLFLSVLWHAVPSRYPLFALTLLVMHAASLVVLYRLLRRWLPALPSAWLLCIYAANVYVVAPLLWFSSGLHRVPFLLASLLSLLAYDHYRRAGRWPSLLAVAAGCLAASLFYAKGPLTLLTIVALEVALGERDGPVSRSRRLIGLLLAALPTIVAFVLLRDFQARHSAGLDFDLARLLRVEYRCMEAFAHVPLGLPSAHRIPTLWLLAPCLAGLVATGLHDRRVARTWLAFLGVLAANFAALSISDRGASYGVAVCGVHRYRFELLHPVCIAVALAWRELWPAVRSPAVRARLRPVLAFFGLVVACQHSLSMPAVADAVKHPGREYVDNLRADLARITAAQDGRPVQLRDGPTPKRALGLTTQYLPMLSHWVFMLGYPVQVGVGERQYLVDGQGHLVPSWRRFRESAPQADGQDIATRAAGGPAEMAPPSPGQAPDVVVVLIDGMRADALAVARRHGRRLPELAGFAATATEYRRAYAQAPRASLSVASLLASRHPHELGPAAHGEQRLVLPPAARPLSQLLAEAGYQGRAVFSHAWVSVETGFGRGFDGVDGTPRWAPAGAQRLERVTDAALASAGAVPAGMPLFLLAHYHGLPTPRPEAGDPGGFPLSPARGRYAAGLAAVDRSVGRLLAGLATRGRLGRAVVMIAGTHGVALGEHGHTGASLSLYDEVQRVPLWVRSPQQARAGRVRRPVALLDLAPTVLALTGLSPESSYRGAELGKSDGRVFMQSHPFGERIAMVQGQYKAILDAGRHTFELYDLEADPHEQHSLLDAHPQLVNLMRWRLEAWYEGAGAQ